MPYSKNKEIVRKMDLELDKTNPDLNERAAKNWLEISKLIRSKEETEYKDSIIYNLRRMNNQVLKSNEELYKEQRLK